MIKTAPPPTPPPHSPFAACGFPRTYDSVGLSRCWLRGIFARLGLDAGTAVQVLSELSTNAIVHGSGEFEVRCYRPLAGRVTVEVADWDPRMPVQRTPAVEDEDGRGLLLVDALSECWGVRPEPTGKVVWFLLRAES